MVEDIRTGDKVRILHQSPGVYYNDKDLVGVVLQRIVFESRHNVLPGDYVVVMMPSGIRHKVPTNQVRKVTQEWVEVPNQEGAYHGKHRRT